MADKIKLRKVARRSKTISDSDENQSPTPTPEDFLDVDSDQRDISGTLNPSRMKKFFRYMDLASVVIIIAEGVAKTGQNPCEEPTLAMTVTEVLIFLFFMSDMVLKIYHGHRRGGHDLKTHWMKLDVLIICVEILDYILKRHGIDWRISQPIRPLRVINRLEFLRKFVHGLLTMIPSVMHIFILYIIIICISSIVGVQLWAGQLRNRCFLGGNVSSIYNVSLNPYYVSELGDSDAFICSVYGHGTQHCSDVPRLRENGRVCMLDPPDLPQNLTSPTSARMNQSDCINWNTFYNVCRPDGPNPYMGAINFDNLGSACLAILQVISLEGWTDIMYLVMATSSFWIFLFFIIVTGFGSFVFLNTCTMFVANSYPDVLVSEEESQIVAFFRKLRHNINERLDNLWTRDMEQTEDRQAKREAIPWLRFHDRLRDFVLGPFEQIMMFFVILSTFNMIMDHHDMSATWIQALSLCDIILFAVFVFECVLRLMVLKVSYFFDLENVFNFGILMVSVMEIGGNKNRKLSFLRSLRMLRIMNVFQSIPYLKRMMLVLKRSVRESTSLGCFVLLLIYIFSIIGINVFGCNFEYAGGDLINDRKNFDSLISAMVTVFQVLTQEDWNYVMYNAMAVTSPVAALYFVALNLFGKNVLFNILVGIVVECFQESEGGEEEEEEEDEDEDEDEDDEPAVLIEHPLLYEEDEQSNPQEDSVLVELPDAILNNAFMRRIHAMIRWRRDHEDWSLFLFSPTNKIRCFCHSVCTHKVFFYGMIAFLVINCVIITTERPGIGPNSTERFVLNILTNVVTVVFVVELAIKVIALGFILGKGTYCKCPWNLMDGMLVISSCVDIILKLQGVKEQSPIFQSLKPFWLLRLFQFLGMAPQASRVKVVMGALSILAKPMICVVVISCQFFLFFAIAGVQLFKGMFFYCVGEDLSNIKNKTDCLEAGYRWILKEYNFDNFMNAVTTLFVMFSKDGWVRIMYDGVDGVEVDQQPVKDYNLWMLVYFLSFMVLAFFLFDMFVGMMVDTYQSFIELYGNKDTSLPSVQDNELKAPDFLRCGAFRRMLLSACTSQWLEIITFTIVVINIVLMGFEHYNQPKYIDQLIDYTFIISTVILFIEVAMKVIAFGPKRFFKDRWNLLDIFVILSSLMDIVLTNIKMPKNFPFNTGILRIFRLFRVTQALWGQEMMFLLKIIGQTSIEVLHIFMLILVLSSMYAIFGVQLFGKFDCPVERPCLGLHRFSNFKTFPMALLTLYKVCTGDNWSGILKDCLRFTNNSWIGPIYFCSFVAIVQFFILNLIVAYIAAILDEEDTESQDLHESFSEEEGREGARRDNPEEDNSNESEHLQRGQVQRDCFEVISLNGDSL